MTTTSEQLGQWLAAPRESKHLEFKEAKNQYDNEKLFWHCVAIANEGGGKLILGVTDQVPRKIVGTSAFHTPEGIQSKILDKLRFHVEVEEVLHPDGRVLIFHIPSRPRGTAYALDGAYAMRSPDGTVFMTEDRLRKIFDEGKPDWLEEHTKSGLNPQQIIDLLDTQTFFELLGLGYPSDRESVTGRLIAERLVDSLDDGFAIRRLGGLLLAKRLEDFPDLARKAPRVVVYSGNSKLKTKRFGHDLILKHGPSHTAAGTLNIYK